MINDPPWLVKCLLCCSYPGMFLYVFYSWMFNCIALIWHLRYSCVTSRCHERDNFFVQWSLNHCVPIVPSKCHFMAVLCFVFFCRRLKKARVTLGHVGLMGCLLNIKVTEMLLCSCLITSNVMSVMSLHDSHRPSHHCCGGAAAWTRGSCHSEWHGGFSCKVCSECWRWV